MPDTVRGDFSDQICSDCGEGNVEFKHWGPLVPSGAVGCFDQKCITERALRLNLRIGLPVPLGQRTIEGKTAQEWYEEGLMAEQSTALEVALYAFQHALQLDANNTEIQEARKRVAKH